MLTNLSDGTDKSLGFYWVFTRRGYSFGAKLGGSIGSASIRSELQDRSLVGRWVCEQVAPMASEYVNRER